MKKFKHLKSILTVLLIATMCVTLLIGCNPDDEEGVKPTYDEIWATYNSANVKKDTMNVVTKASYFNKGKAEYFMPKLDMVRTMNGDLVLIDGVFYSDVASSGASSTAGAMASMAGLAGMNSEFLSTVQDLFAPVKGDEGKAYFKVGTCADAINAQLDFAHGNELPDYQLPFTDKSFLGSLPSFMGISMEAVDELLESTEHSDFVGMNVAETFMFADIFSMFDMKNMPDSQDSKLNEGKGAYLYSYALTDDQVKNTVISMIEGQFGYLASQMEEETYKEFTRLYNAYRDEVFSMITVTEAKLNMTIPEDLKTVNITCDFNVDISISKAKIKSILEKEPEYKDMIQYLDLIFELASTFGFGSRTNGVTGVMDFSMDVEMSQVIEYEGVTLNTADPIFTSANGSATGRQFYYFKDGNHYDDEGNLNLSVRVDK